MNKIPVIHDYAKKMEMLLEMYEKDNSPMSFLEYERYIENQIKIQEGMEVDE